MLRGSNNIIGSLGGSGFSRVLKSTSVAVSHTGDTNDFILGYINVPGGLMGTDGSIELDLLYGVTGSAGTWVLNVKIITGTVAGTTSGTALVSGTIGAGANQRASFLVCNDHAANAQVCYQNGAAPFTASTNALTTAAIDTASAFTLSINAKLNNASDTIALRHYHGILFPAV